MSKIIGGSGAAEHAQSVYGAAGQQQAASVDTNVIKMNQVGGDFEAAAQDSLASSALKVGGKRRMKRGSSKRSQKGGADDASVDTNVIKMNHVGGDFEAAEQTGIASSALKVGGKRRMKRGSSKRSSKRSRKGGVGLAAAAVPAVLLYANNAFGRGRKSIRLNPMSHFSRGGKNKSKSKRRFSSKR